MKRKIVFLISTLFANFMMAQTTASDRELFAAAPQNNVGLESPKNLTASDGLYDRYVLIHWEPSEQANRYKIFRTDKAKGGTLQEISNSWQQSTWLCDYTATPGMEYFYTVMASNGKENSKASVYDKGFVKKRDLVEDRSLSSNDKNEKFANGNLASLMIDAVSSDKMQYKAGETVNLSVQLINIFDNETVQAELRCYLSKDAVFDFDDKALTLKSFASVPKGANLAVKEMVKIPDNTLRGDYYIILVSATQGAVLSSRVQAYKINVQQ